MSSLCYKLFELKLNLYKYLKTNILILISWVPIEMTESYARDK